MTKRIYNRWKNEDMEEALKKLSKGDIGFNEAHRKYGIPKPTLRRHFKGLNKNIKFGRPKDLPENMQQELVAHVLKLEASFFGLTATDLRKLAYQLGEKYNLPHRFNKDKRIAGKKWYFKFMKDNPCLSLRIPEPTSMARATAFNKENVYKFFDKYESILDEYKFSANQIYNVDETCLSTVHKPSKIIAKKGKHQIGTITSGERGLTTTCVCCMNAAGEFVPPMLIFKRVRMHDSLIKGAPPGTEFRCSKNGWITSEIFVEWLKHFIKHNKLGKSYDKKILLLLDGHTTHTKNIEAINLACEYDIIMLSFPAHTTHRLQPLDRSFFKSLKSSYNEASSAWLRTNPGNTIKQMNVSEIFGIAYARSVRMNIALNGFKSAGLWPCNRQEFQDEDFCALIFETPPPLTDEDNETQGNTAVHDVATPTTSNSNKIKDELNILSPIPNIRKRLCKRTSTAIEITAYENKENIINKKKKATIKKASLPKTTKEKGDWYCPICSEEREDSMIQCLKCKIWIHDICAGVNKRIKKYVCEACTA